MSGQEAQMAIGILERFGIGTIAHLGIVCQSTQTGDILALLVGRHAEQIGKETVDIRKHHLLIELDLLLFGKRLASLPFVPGDDADAATAHGTIGQEGSRKTADTGEEPVGLTIGQMVNVNDHQSREGLNVFQLLSSGKADGYSEHRQRSFDTGSGFCHSLLLEVTVLFGALAKRSICTDKVNDLFQTGFVRNLVRETLKHINRSHLEIIY